MSPEAMEEILGKPVEVGGYNFLAKAGDTLVVAFGVTDFYQAWFHPLGDIRPYMRAVLEDLPTWGVLLRSVGADWVMTGGDPFARRVARKAGFTGPQMLS